MHVEFLFFASNFPLQNHTNRIQEKVVLLDSCLKLHLSYYLALRTRSIIWGKTDTLLSSAQSLENNIQQIIQSIPRQPNYASREDENDSCTISAWISESNQYTFIDIHGYPPSPMDIQPAVCLGIAYLIRDAIITTKPHLTMTQAIPYATFLCRVCATVSPQNAWCDYNILRALFWAGLILTKSVDSEGKLNNNIFGLYCSK
jgi:hypothetical protein